MATLLVNDIELPVSCDGFNIRTSLQKLFDNVFLICGNRTMQRRNLPVVRWTWRLGPSNSSERGHVMEILKQEEFPENTLFCGDAGFVGYDFWNAILTAEGNFLVRVGGNVNLLSEQADIKRLGGGMVLCWPKGKMNSGAESGQHGTCAAKVSTQPEQAS